MTIKLRKELLLQIYRVDHRKYTLDLENPNESELFKYLLESIQGYFLKPTSVYQELSEIYKIKDEKQRKEYQRKLLNEIKSLSA